MDNETEDWIFRIKCLAVNLREAAEEFQYDTSCSPFDIQDARDYFKTVWDLTQKLKDLLNDEPGESDSE